MDQFICKHGDVIHGALSCFDRMLFRGYLPIMSGGAMAEFLQAKGVHRWSLKTFLLTQAARLKKHAMQMAAAAGRPYQYLGERTRKEDLARQIANRDGIDEGLICVFALLEVSRTFSVVWKEHNSFVQSTRRKCLQLYYYFMDRELGAHPRQAADLVPVPDASLPQRSRVAGAQARPARGQVPQGRQRLRGPERRRARATDLRPIPEPRLGAGARALRQADQSTARRVIAANGILLGDSAGRVFDGYPLPLPTS